MRRWQRIRQVLAIGLMVVSVWATCPDPLAAQEMNGPEFRIAFLGDSLGDGVWAGIYQILHKDKRFKLLRLADVGSGFHSMSLETWQRKLDAIIAKHNPNVAVVVMGGNDIQPVITPGRKRYPFKSEEWRELYGERVDGYMKSLVDNQIHTFWVGLPAMRDQQYDQDVQYINEIFKASAARNGVTYVSIWELTVDENGQYTAYGPDLTGRRVLLRAKDGKHFTLQGYELMAQRVLEAIQGKIPEFSWETEND